MQEVLVSLIAPIVTGLLSYLGARHQSKKDLQKLRESHNHEMKKINLEMEKQAELYEKNAQTDLTGDFFTRFLDGDDQVIDKLERLNKLQESGLFQQQKHPARRRK